MSPKTVSKGVNPGIARLSRVEDEIRQRKADEERERQAAQAAQRKTAGKQLGKFGAVALNGQALEGQAQGGRPATIERLEGQDGAALIKALRDKYRALRASGRREDFEVGMTGKNISDVRGIEGHEVTYRAKVRVSPAVQDKIKNKHMDGRVLPVGGEPVSMYPQDMTESCVLAVTVAAAAQVQQEAAPVRQRKGGVQPVERDRSVKLHEAVIQNFPEAERERIRKLSVKVPLAPPEKAKEGELPQVTVKSSYPDYRRSDARQYRSNREISGGVQQEVVKLYERQDGKETLKGIVKTR